MNDGDDDGRLITFLLGLEPEILQRAFPHINFAKSRKTIGALVDLVTKHSGPPGNAALVHMMLEKLKEISTDNEKRSDLVSAGAIEAESYCLAAYIEVPEVVREWAWFTLFISLSDDPRVPERILAAGVPDQLLSVLDLYCDNCGLVIDVLCAIGNVCSVSTEARDRLTTTGSIFPRLARIMDSNSKSADILRWCSYAIKWLTHSNHGGNVCAAQAGIPARLVRTICDTSVITGALLGNVALALGNVSYMTSECQAEIHACGGLDTIVAILRAIVTRDDGGSISDEEVAEHTDKTLVVSLCYAMNNIASGYYAAQEFLLREGALGILVRLMEIFSATPNVVENALFAISTIICNNYLSQLELVRLGAIPTILRVGHTYATSEHMLTALFLALGNTSGDSVETKSEIAGGGALGIALAALERFPDSGTLCARVARCVEFVLSTDENYEKYASEEVVAAIRAAAARHPELLELKNCLLSVTRTQDPEIVRATAMGACSATVNPHCADMCPYRRGKFYCPKCAKPQYTYFCVECSVEKKSTLRLCTVCAKRHAKEHANHTLLKTFMSRRCYSSYHLNNNK